MTPAPFSFLRLLDPLGSDANPGPPQDFNWDGPPRWQPSPPPPPAPPARPNLPKRRRSAALGELARARDALLRNISQERRMSQDRAVVWIIPPADARPTLQRVQSDLSERIRLLRQSPPSDF